MARKITLSEFADELERHLLGTEGTWDWDDTTSLPLQNDALEKLRQKLPKFDLLVVTERRNELAEIIAALRRGEIPNVKSE